MASALWAIAMMVFTWKKVQKLLLWLFALSVVVGISMYPTSATSRELPQASNSKPAIVLVHGAFADGTSWQHVIPIIPLLEQDGYRVTAVQIPLTSLADNVVTTKRVINASLVYSRTFGRYTAGTQLVSIMLVPAKWALARWQ